MKKVVSMIVAAMMVCCIGMTTFAAGSPIKVEPVVDTSATTVAEEATIGGVAVEKVAVAAGTADTAAAAAAPAKLTELAQGQVAGAAVAYTLMEVSVKDASGNVLHPSATEPVKVTFQVATGLDARIAPMVMHWNGTDWEVVVSSFDRATGKLTATFTSLSPVAIVYASTVTADPSGSSAPAVSPTTGENGFVALAWGVLLAAGVCTCAVVCKKRKN